MRTASSSDHVQSHHDPASLAHTTNTLRRLWDRFLADYAGDHEILVLQLREYDKREDKSEDAFSMMYLWLDAFIADMQGYTNEIDDTIAELVDNYYTQSPTHYAELERVLMVIATTDELEGLRHMASCLLGIY